MSNSKGVIHVRLFKNTIQLKGAIQSIANDKFLDIAREREEYLIWRVTWVFSGWVLVFFCQKFYTTEYGF